VADSLRDQVYASGVRITSIFRGRTPIERQRAIFAAEGRPHQPGRLIQPADVAELFLSVLRLPRTSKVIDIVREELRRR